MVGALTLFVVTITFKAVNEVKEQLSALTITIDGNLCPSFYLDTITNRSRLTP